MIRSRAAMAKDPSWEVLAPLPMRPETCDLQTVSSVAQRIVGFDTPPKVESQTVYGDLGSPSTPQALASALAKELQLQLQGDLGPMVESFKSFFSSAMSSGRYLGGTIAASSQLRPQPR